MSETQTDTRRKIRIAGRQFPVPGSAPARITIGLLFMIGGLFGFLPVVGFWMIPVGLVILSVDFPAVRRLRRRLDVRVGRWWAETRAKWRK